MKDRNVHFRVDQAVYDIFENLFIFGQDYSRTEVFERLVLEENRRKEDDR